jgi:hypothetical protein
VRGKLICLAEAGCTKNELGNCRKEQEKQIVDDLALPSEAGELKQDNYLAQCLGEITVIEF